MYDGPVIDAHIHLWDPRTTPRTVTPLVRLLGRTPRLVEAVARRAVPAAALAFVGRPDQVLHPYLPGTWYAEARAADVRGFVHVQADWQAADELGHADETRWLEQVCGRDLLAVVGRADLAHPRLGELLDAHAAASDRFAGIRDYLAHGGEDEGVMSFAASPDRTAEHAWRVGFDLLGQRGLTFDAWAYAPQLPAVARLAAEQPGTDVVLCHVGSPVGAGGPFGGRGRTAADRQRIRERWAEDLAAVAANPQVRVKLSGLGMPILGWGWHDRPSPPGVDEVVDAWGPFTSHALAVFGPDRCMAASNFPMDRVSLPWATAFEALDQLTADLGPDERRQVFSGTAAATYRLALPDGHDSRPDPPPPSDP